MSVCVYLFVLRLADGGRRAAGKRLAIYVSATEGGEARYVDVCVDACVYVCMWHRA